MQSSLLGCVFVGLSEMSINEIKNSLAMIRQVLEAAAIEPEGIHSIVLLFENKFLARGH